MVPTRGPVRLRRLRGCHGSGFLDRSPVAARPRVSPSPSLRCRGGGELGRRWYEAGKYEHKTRSFGGFRRLRPRTARSRPHDARSTRDSAADRPADFSSEPPSTWTPDLFGAVVAEVPFVDVVNTMIDTTQQLTQIEWDEWGNPLESEGDLPSDDRLQPLRERELAARIRPCT